MAARNPILEDPEIARRFGDLQPEARAALYDFAAWLYPYAKSKAEESWQSSKAPMAVYWKAVAAWSFHLRRTLYRKQ